MHVYWFITVVLNCNWFSIGTEATLKWEPLRTTICVPYRTQCVEVGANMLQLGLNELRAEIQSGCRLSPDEQRLRAPRGVCWQLTLNDHINWEQYEDIFRTEESEICDRSVAHVSAAAAQTALFSFSCDIDDAVHATGGPWTKVFFPVPVPGAVIYEKLLHVIRQKSLFWDILVK